MDVTELSSTILSIFSDFADPKKRVFVGYLFLSLLIAFAWMIFIRHVRPGKAGPKIFDKKIFLSASAIADYKIFVINKLFSFLISPLLVTQLAIATAIFYALHNQSFIPQNYLGDTNKGLVIALFSLTMFVVDDLTKYLVHRWMHVYPLLWAIHKVHHSAETLTPVTVYRVHPLEGILYGLRGTFAHGIVLSLFYFLFGNIVDIYSVVGINVLVFAFHVTGSNLRHSHINISYWPWLEHVLISPAQHQIHHSLAEKHFDKNFGAALAIWDWLFGSLHVSDPDEELAFGLDDSQRSSGSDLKILYWGPIVDMGRVIRRRYRKYSGKLAHLFGSKA